MALLNHAKKELSAKIVYYGPGLSGKTTNLEWIHRKLAPDKRGKLISLETKTDRTLFFDFLPVQIGEISGFRTRFNVYTVPGQIFYNETRRMVLKGVDGIVFVADSQKEMANENLENLKNLAENLRSIGKELSKIPLVIQFNKRDLPNILSVDEMNRLLNAPGLPFFEAVAVKGEGVLTTLTRITRVVADHLKQTLFASPKQEPSAPPPYPESTHEPPAEPSPSFPDSTGQPSEPSTPAFLNKKPDAERGTPASEPQVVSQEKEISHSNINAFKGQKEAAAPTPSLASVGAHPGQSLAAEEIPSLGDLGEAPEAPPLQPTIPTLTSEDGAAPRQSVTPVPPKEVAEPEVPPKEVVEPEVPSMPDAAGASAKTYWIDPSVVSISAQAAAQEVSGPEAQKGIAIRFGDPERDTGNQVRLPVALRLEGSNEIISFQMVIRIDQESDGS
jgi:signal recognition particle receptor subunit beta